MGQTGPQRAPRHIPPSRRTPLQLPPLHPSFSLPLFHPVFMLPSATSHTPDPSLFLSRNKPPGKRTLLLSISKGILLDSSSLGPWTPILLHAEPSVPAHQHVGHLNIENPFRHNVELMIQRVDVIPCVEPGLYHRLGLEQATKRDSWGETNTQDSLL